MHKRALVFIIGVLIVAIGLSVGLIMQMNESNSAQTNFSAISSPSPTPVTVPSPTPTTVATPTPTPTIISSIEPAPVKVEVPVPEFTVNQTIRTDVNSATGQSYSTPCAQVIIKNELVVDYYEIKYKGHFRDNWLLGFNVDKSASDYTLSPLTMWLTPGTYDFKVRAFDASGLFSSDWSPIQSITITN